MPSDVENEEEAKGLRQAEAARRTTTRRAPWLASPDRRRRRRPLNEATDRQRGRRTEAFVVVASLCRYSGSLTLCGRPCHEAEAAAATGFLE